MKPHWIVVFESARETDAPSATFSSPPEPSRARAIEDARRMHLSPYGGTVIRVEGSDGEVLSRADLEAIWGERG